jgi:creatinine amidohydrolase/Fe(II)-dependent formamide hydrolase-like protein
MNNDSSIKALQVIDILEVGPVRVEPQRLCMPYRVYQGEHSESIELVYKFEDPVFEPDLAEDRNLAAMIGAQVALNYGLFCREIKFNDVMDEHDRTLLGEMAGNTAREIYVKKILQPNVFLRPPAVDLPVEKLKDYCQATLTFARERPADVQFPAWNPNIRRTSVLSSGGKDSLLSYGLLQELGYDTHPIFINESGRHWFTALNSYRYFKDNVPETARVWSNCDRLFSWMLRFLPFIRKDFADVRADDYPVRLWTVAVFLFGALPLLRKRGIGRLVIGDEYDTSRRLNYKGITHYDGLYDQSRWFDNAMSRYFHRKGWGISQFSLLRPLSEFLILKILAQRYPQLQSHQVSCHAAHSVDERIYPCGKCEKCRRIVGMLMAQGVDPKNCGYREEQIGPCLEAFVSRGVHHEGTLAEEVARLLHDRGLLERPEGKSQVRHPEVFSLRFDSERSPVDGVPVDLRRPLNRIFLEYAEGAVRKQGRDWRPFNATGDPDLGRPYIFERRKGPDGQGALPTFHSMEKRSHVLADLSWPEAKKRFKEVDVVLLPVGATEQHGPHLPLDVDSFDAEYLALRVAEECREPRPLVLPLIPYGVSYHHDDFSGTLSVSPETLSRLVHEVGIAVARHGITKLIIINGHGGNAPSLHFAAQMINRDAHIFVAVDTGETSDSDVESMAHTLSDVHAGEIETSMTLAIRPHLVNMDKASKEVPDFSSRYLDFHSHQSVNWFARTRKISDSGVMGDATRGEQEKGRKMWRVMIDHLVAFVEQIKNLSLDEIYRRQGRG